MFQLINKCVFLTRSNKDIFLFLFHKLKQKLACCELSATIFNFALNTRDVACCSKRHVKKHDGDYEKLIRVT